jgi:serine protease Do
MVHTPLRRLARAAALSAAALVSLPSAADDGPPAAIAKLKPSIVAVGTFNRLRNPQFNFAGTGFAVGKGLHIATNAHVLPREVDIQRNESLAVALRTPNGSVQVRAARRAAFDPSHDLALLEIQGEPLPAVSLGDSGTVREGETYLLTGFPIGAVLGLYPVTHRSMIAALTPIVIPAARADQLDAKAVRRLARGSFGVFQLDGTAYPGNSGSPVYHPETGAVIGIVNSVFVKGTKEAALSAPSGITYAIPVEKLKRLLGSIL